MLTVVPCGLENARNTGERIYFLKKNRNLCIMFSFISHIFVRSRTTNLGLRNYANAVIQLVNELLFIFLAYRFDLIICLNVDYLLFII